MNQQVAEYLIAVDIGNSSFKVALFAGFDGRGPAHPQSVTRIGHGQTLDELARSLPESPCRWAVVSVNRAAEATLATWVRTHRPRDRYWVLRTTDFPLRIDVEHPGRVGADRLAAAVAANHLRCHGQPAIVIDSGTAITVDLLDTEGIFRGGVIMAGPAVAAAALATHTDALPLVSNSSLKSPPTPIGKSTEAAIRCGLVWGTIGAVKELVSRISDTLVSSPHLFCTGYDAALLAEQLGAEAQYDPLLVLRGIVYTANDQ